MALKKSNHKIQSSLANFVFVNNDLSSIWNSLDWQKFAALPVPIVRTEKDFLERIEAIKLSVLTHHTEIIRQALHEYIKILPRNIHTQYLDSLGWFLFDLRNAFSHTKGKLIAQWDPKGVNSPQTFKINIPIKHLGANLIFKPNSKITYKFVWKRIIAQRD